MPTLYENYNTGDDGNRGFYQTLSWLGQTFTPATSHVITSVKVKLLRITSDATPGTITASILATDGSGIPTGSALASGTYPNGNTITTTSPGEWIEITLTLGYPLDSGTVYALALKCQTDDTTKPIAWRKDARGVGPAPTYSGGAFYSTANEGVTWTLIGSMGTDDEDAMFEDWGNPTFIPQVIMII